MKSALQAWKLWLLVDSLEECSPISTSKPFFIFESLSYLISLVEYKDWLKLREDYLDWLQSDSTAMSLMKATIKFGQYKHIANISTSKEI